MNYGLQSSTLRPDDAVDFYNTYKGTNYATGTDSDKLYGFQRAEEMPKLGDTEGFDWRGNAKLGFKGLQTLSGLANAYTAYKQMQNAEDQLSLQEEFANKNYDATRKTMNNEIARRARVDAAFRGLAGADAEAFEQDALKKQGI